jgi:hypothetical protein
LLQQVGIIVDFNECRYEILEEARFQERLGTRNHYLLRMTRVLRFMHLMHPYHANQLANFLASHIRNRDTNPTGLLNVTQETARYWFEAVRKDSQLRD